MSTVLNPDPPGRVPSVSGRNSIVSRNVKLTLVHPEKNPGLRETPREEEED